MPLTYSRAAFRALAVLPQAQRDAVRETATALVSPNASAATIRALPGGLDQGLSQVAVEGFGRLVCAIDDDRVTVLALVPRAPARPAQQEGAAA